jgi:SAM-dependent methyltransferase
MAVMSKDTMTARLTAFEDRPEAVALRRRTYALLPAAGVIVDAGCGTGPAVAELGSRAIGFDASAEMIAAGRRRFPEADLRVGDICDLPLADGEVAGYRADKVLHQLAEPDRAVAEAARVLAPGGRIVLVGHDWEAVIIEADDAETTRRIMRDRAAAIASPRAARGYRSLLLDAGFTDVTVEVHTPVATGATAVALLTGLAGGTQPGSDARAGVGPRTGADTQVGPDAQARADHQARTARQIAWLDALRTRAAADRLLVAIPIFLATGSR